MKRLEWMVSIDKKSSSFTAMAVETKPSFGVKKEGGVLKVR